MKIGDKVRFLNTIGGGTVKGFQTKDIAIVEDQDGFDIPILIRECIVIDTENEVQVRKSVKTENKPSSYVIEAPADKPIQIEETKKGEQITACIVFLAIDEKNISTTGYDTYIVNDSNYYLSYIYMNKETHGWLKRSTGIIEPNSKVFIEEINKEDLNDLERVCIQFFAYKEDKPFHIKNVCSSELKIDTVKFYKLHSFKENDYFEDNAIVYPLMKKDLVEKEFIINPTDLEEALLSKNKLTKQTSKTTDKRHNTRNDILETDLHIEELLDDTRGLEPSVILDYQLSKFREIMDENLHIKGKKIVFIHGKGNGVLKKTLLNELRLKYKSCYYQDASFKEYGFGATMITVR